MTRRTLTKAIFEKLGEVGMATLDGFFPRNYPYAAIWRPLLGLDTKRKINRQTVSTILWRLKREGLVEHTPGRNSSWLLTERGRQVYADQRNTKSAGKDGITRLVVFDVPEHARKKRDAIRAELVAARYTQLQKSVWIGVYPLPQDFITLVDELELEPHVHIFSVCAEGTLKKRLATKVKDGKK